MQLLQPILPIVNHRTLHAIGPRMFKASRDDIACCNQACQLVLSVGHLLDYCVMITWGEGQILLYTALDITKDSDVQ